MIRLYKLLPLMRWFVRKRIDGLVRAGFDAHYAGDRHQTAALAAQALALDDGHFEAHYLAGLAALASTRAEEAQGSFLRAIDAKPDFARPFGDLVFCLWATGKPAMADRVAALAVARFPADTALFNRIGEIYLATRPQFAEGFFRRTLELEPVSETALFGLAYALLGQGKTDEATLMVERARAANASEQLLEDLSGALALERGDFASVQALLQQRLARNPADTTALVNSATIEERLGRFDTLRGYLERIVAVQPHHASANYALAACDLRTGDYARGFAGFEWRRKLGTSSLVPTIAGVPEWGGEDPRGKRILVLEEQGFGDSFLFVRFVLALSAQGALVTFSCHAATYALYGNCPGFDSIQLLKGAPAPPLDDTFDFAVPLVSLPFQMRARDTAYQAGHPYIRVHEDVVAHWARRLPENGTPRIGLVWQSNVVTGEMGKTKSMQFATLWAALGSLPVHFVSLQLGAQGDTDSAGTPVKSGAGNLLDLTDEITDFADTAAIITNLDMVVSVDTSVANLCGAIGKALIVLCPMQVDWRWHALNGVQVWFPDDTVVLAQDAPGDWSAPLHRTHEIIGERFSAAS